MSAKAERLLGSDNLPARDNGAWAQDKLSFLDEYFPPALDALQAKHQRYFLDLFAGPGINVDARRSGAEFEGSTLRALQLHGAREPRSILTHITAVNLDETDHRTLEQRIERRYKEGRALPPRASVKTLRGNANYRLREILQPIHPQAFVFVFADIEAMSQWPWRSVQLLRAFKHESIELCLLFPLEMGIMRQVSFNAEDLERKGPALTRFYGDDSWRSLVAKRVTGAQAGELRQGLLQLYMEKLRHAGWPFVRVARDVRREDGGRLYKLIHATAHVAGDRIAQWEVRRDERKDQFDFGL